MAPYLGLIEEPGHVHALGLPLELPHRQPGPPQAQDALEVRVDVQGVVAHQQQAIPSTQMFGTISMIQY